MLSRRLLTEFPMKACSDCCFSNGGHQFAAASNNAIVVYNTCTCELLGTLRCSLTVLLATDAMCTHDSLCAAVSSLELTV